MNRALASVGILFCVASCGPGPMPDQFGAYPANPAHLRLASGQSLAVYRIKYWEFRDGSSPALQIEYEAPFSVDDTAAVRRMAVELWPFFRGLVDTLNLSGAILTATNRQQHRFFFYRWSRRHSFGLVADRVPDGSWRFQGHAEVLPSRESPFVNRMVTADGSPWPISATPPPVP